MIHTMIDSLAVLKVISIKFIREHSQCVKKKKMKEKFSKKNFKREMWFNVSLPCLSVSRVFFENVRFLSRW